MNTLQKNEIDELYEVEIADDNGELINIIEEMIKNNDENLFGEIQMAIEEDDLEYIGIIEKCVRIYNSEGNQYLTNINKFMETAKKAIERRIYVTETINEIIEDLKSTGEYIYDIENIAWDFFQMMETCENE